MDTRDKRRKTTRDCSDRKERSPSGQLISQVVSQKKRVSGDPSQPNKTGEDRRQFLSDLPESLRKKERWRRAQSESQIGGEDKWQSSWCCRGQQRVSRMAQASAEKLEHTGPAEKKRVASMPQREQLASTPQPSLPKGKGAEPSVQSTRS